MTQPMIDWTPDGVLEVLTFDLRGETFALEAVLVREIIDLLPETVVPGAPALVGGVVNFRGKIIPIADLGLAFGMPPAEPSLDSRIIVIDLAVGGEQCLLGVRTDKVHEVATLDASATEHPPAIGMRWHRHYVRGLIRRGDDIVVLPDLHAIFATMVGADGAAVPASH